MNDQARARSKTKAQAVTVRSTHDIEIADGHVIKRFRSWDRGEHQREWQALNVLAEFAPGLVHKRPGPGAGRQAERVLGLLGE